MRAISACVLSASCLLPAFLFGDVNFSFEFELESEEYPDIETTERVDGPPGHDARWVARMTLGSAGLNQDDEGPQGWSCSIWHAGLDIEELSILDTVAAFEADGGLRVAGEKNSFFVFETLDKTLNEGRRGAVQACVLSFVTDVFLPPNTKQVIGRIHFKATIEEEGRVVFFRYHDGQRGRGQPVTNLVTLEGNSRFPSLSGREILVGKGATPESGDECNDGVDNDGDTWADELDPGCENLGGGEDCHDGADNDGDGLIDCADPSCHRGGVCPEICDDGADNDGDGAVDCEDANCVGFGDCPELEDCADGIDNDEDGLVDCDDPQCSPVPACRVFEDCADGIDNDEDGVTDCEDPECIGVPPCPVPERCNDGLDNDEDGEIDCDDKDCASVGACLNREDCADGIDNDLDGRVDCEDRDCGGQNPCPPLELCDGGIDEDGDGLVDCDDPSCAGEVVCGGVSGFDLVITAAGARRERPDADGATGDTDGADGTDGGAGGAPSSERNVVDVATSTFDAVVFIVPVPGPQKEGVQGWSLAIAHDRAIMRFLGATIAGTDAENLFAGGFQHTEGAGSNRRSGAPAGGAGGGDPDGFVSAVVLSFNKPTTLDPTIPQSVARATYGLRGEPSSGSAGAGSGVVGFEDGLQGTGQPVNNVLTIDSQSHRPVHSIGLEVRPVPGFIRGDPNADGKLNIADAIWILNEMLRSGPRSPCQEAADVNGDQQINIADPVYLAHFEFLGGTPPPAPFPECGAGTSELPCVEGSCR